MTTTTATATAAFRPYKLNAVYAAWSTYRRAQSHAKAEADAARAAYDAAAADLREIIARAEGRATARRLSVDDIMQALDRVPDCIAKKHLPGCEIHCNPSAQGFARAYHYVPESTHFSAVCRPAGWYLTRVCRDTCGTSRGCLTLTDAAKADIIAAAETL